MATTGDKVEGTAEVMGELWGARARDWAEAQEARHRPLYEWALDAVAVGPGKALLDAGCGTGMASEMAAKRGAKVTGLDASAASIEIAKGRVPGGDFRVGEIESLPYADNSFDAVIGINSFEYAAKPVNALREARRVAQPGAPVVMIAWGDPKDCQAVPYLEALMSLLPPPPPGAPGPFALSEPGALEALAKEAGLTPQRVQDVDCLFDYPDLDTALKGLVSAGPAALAIQLAGEERVREACVRAIATLKTASGGYRMENKFRCLIATA